MRRKKRSLKLLFVTMLTLGGFLYLLFFTKPAGEFSFEPIRSSPIPLFLLLLFIFLSSAITYLIGNMRKGLFIGAGIVGYLILRFLNLAQPFFITVLIALLISLAFVFFSRRN